jgi:hypothetical protein
VLMEMKLVCPYWNVFEGIESKGAKFSSIGLFTFAIESSPGIEDLTSGKLVEIAHFLDFCLSFSSFPSSLNLDSQTVTYGQVIIQ